MMKKFLTPPLSTIIWAAMLIHIIQAISIICTPLANGAIDIASILQFVSIEYAPAFMIFATGLAFIGLLDIDSAWYVRLVLLLPQQALITIAMSGAIMASIHGSYFDGTLKPGIHIFVDQLWLIGYFFIHAISVVRRSIS